MIIVVIDFNFDEMISLIEQRKNNAYRKVNEELILLYLDVEKHLYELIENSNYGDKIIVKATKFMKDNYLNTRILDTYSLEFLDLPKEFSENDFKKTIIKNMKDFILEVGKDFTFISDEYRI